MMLTGSGSPAECCGIDTDRIEHHRFAILVRVEPRRKHPIERVKGPVIDKQAPGYARKVSLFLFCISHDGRSTQRERDIRGLCLNDVVRDLVHFQSRQKAFREASVYSDRNGEGKNT